MPNLSNFRPMRFCTDCQTAMPNDGYVNWQEDRVCIVCAVAQGVPVMQDPRMREIERGYAQDGLLDVEKFLASHARFQELYPE